MYIYISV